MRRAEAPSPVDRLDAVRSLRFRSRRDRTGTHFVEGLRAVFSALDARVPVETLVYAETLAPPLAQQRVRRAKRCGIPVLRVSPEEFRSLSRTPHASGLGAVLRQHWSAIEEADAHAGLCWVAVSLVRTPGNLGTLLRTAEAAGAAGVIFLGDLTDPFDPLVVGASKGGIFRLRLVRTTEAAFAAWVAREDCRVIGTSPGATVAHTDIELDRPLVALFGEERRGLTARELALCASTVSIGMDGAADSLNIAVAAGVVLFDLRRRRGSGCR